MQEIRLSGNIGQEAKVMTSQSGKQFGLFSMGCQEKIGENPDKTPMFKTTWYRVFCNVEDVQYLTKGRKVEVIGKPTASAYIDKNTNTPMATISVSNARILFQMPKVKQAQQTQFAQQVQQTIANGGIETDVMPNDDELPF